MSDIGFIRIAESMALTNWLMWHRDFSHFASGGEFENLPVLNDIDRFSAFTSEYSLSRNIPGGPGEDKETAKRKRAKKRRLVVMKFFKSHPPTSSGENAKDYSQRLADYANQKHGELAKLDNPRRQVSASVSLVSKVFSFWNPIVYPAFDQFVQKATKAEDYEDYQCKFRARLKEFKECFSPSVNTLVLIGKGNERAFTARVLDVKLMKEGGRWSGLKFG